METGSKRSPSSAAAGNPTFPGLATVVGNGCPFPVWRRRHVGTPQPAASGSAESVQAVDAGHGTLVLVRGWATYMGRGGEGLEAGRMRMPLCLLGFRGCGGGGEMDGKTATDDGRFGISKGRPGRA